MKTVHIIGLGLSMEDLTVRHLKLIEKAQVLVGGERHLAYFKTFKGRKKTIDRHIGEVIDYIQKARQDRRVVVLASGDPLFFGIGSLLVKKLGGEAVELHPNISSLAAAFARIKASWSDARWISLHGRERQFEVLEALKQHRPVGILTDPAKAPSWLAQFLTEHRVVGARMAVFSRLGSDDEKITWCTLQEAARLDVKGPHLVILHQKSEQTPGFHIGMPESAYRTKGGLITKKEVRVAALGQLALLPGQTLWDLGAGSGSVGLEASLLLGAGRICAVEQYAERVAQIEANAARWEVFNLETFCCQLPGGLDKLPLPDRIFIGGGGRNLETILEKSISCLPQGGVIVASTVLLQNLQVAVNTMKAMDLRVAATQVQVCQSRVMPYGDRFESQNPVWLIRGERAV